MSIERGLQRARVTLGVDFTTLSEIDTWRCLNTVSIVLFQRHIVDVGAIIAFCASLTHTIYYLFCIVVFSFFLKDSNYYL